MDDDTILGIIITISLVVFAVLCFELALASDDKKPVHEKNYLCRYIVHEDDSFHPCIVEEVK
jgi:hypothetical protein